MRVDFMQAKYKYARRIYRYRYFYLMILPAIVFYLLFHYLPMYGVRMAFFEYGVMGQKEFIGFENFIRLFNSEMFLRATRNTLIISFYNLAMSMIASITFALLLNEITHKLLKKFLQTLAYLPHFLSWVVVSSIFALILSPDSGVINELIKYFGGDPVYFLASEKWWVHIFILICRWKETGWGAIIFLAALTGIDTQLYEASAIDGAGRLRQTWHITLPSLKTTILVVFILNLSNILYIFQPVFVMINPLVYSVADVIGTYTYRVGLIEADYDFSTAVGLFQSVISMFLVFGANYISKRVRGEGIL